jgi:O-methyltransferase
MYVSSFAQRLLGRDIMVRLSYAAYRCGVIIAAPMHSLRKTRNHSVLFGEYIRASSLELVAREIHEHQVPGAVAELGVYRGEFARLINAAFPEKPLYLFDTFSGFAESDLKKEIDTMAPPGAFSNTSISTVMSKMTFKQNCIIKEGLFPHSAADCKNERFCFVSIDADLYNPICEGLRYFYSRLSPGGYIFVHDYNNLNYPGAKRALRQFCLENNVPYFPLSDASGSAIIARPLTDAANEVCRELPGS